MAGAVVPCQAEFLLQRSHVLRMEYGLLMQLSLQGSDVQLAGWLGGAAVGTLGGVLCGAQGVVFGLELQQRAPLVKECQVCGAECLLQVVHLVGPRSGFPCLQVALVVGKLVQVVAEIAQLADGGSWHALIARAAAQPERTLIADHH